MPLHDLANELLLSVAENFNKLSDLNAFARTNQRLYFLLNGYLYRIDVQQGGSSALLWAAEHGLERTAQLSLTEKADREATRRDNRQSTSIRPGPFNYRGLLVKFKFDNHNFIETPLLTSLTPLQLAVCHKHEFVARLLIEHGANIRKAYPERMAKCTPLHLASAHGLTAAVQLLLDKGANLEARDEQGQTPLHYAVKPNEYRSRRHGNVKTVLCLLEKGAKYGTRDRSGRRPEDLVHEHVLGWRWSEREQEEDYRAEKRIKQLLEAKGAERIVEKWDRDRESSRKKRIATEKALQERLVNRKRERTLNDRLRKEAQRKTKEELQKIAEETEAARKRTEEERLEAQRKAKEELQKIAEETEAARKRAEEARLAEISLRERQEAARKKWSQLREQAEQRTRVLGTCSAIVSSGCTHSSIGWLKNKARAQCQLCERICAKYSFQCPDCGSVACMQCKLQHC
jgi:ankyrin repeat protein